MDYLRAHVYDLVTAAAAVAFLCGLYHRRITAFLRHPIQEAAHMPSFFDFLKTAETLVPVFLPLVPGGPALSKLTPFIISGLQVAEQTQGATGQQKLAIAVAEVNNGIAALNAVKPGTIDGAAVNDAIVSGINTTIKAINAVKSAQHSNG
jgi:hypothetical protein